MRDREILVDLDNAEPANYAAAALPVRSSQRGAEGILRTVDVRRILDRSQSAEGAVRREITVVNWRWSITSMAGCAANPQKVIQGCA